MRVLFDDRLRNLRPQQDEDTASWALETEPSAGATASTPRDGNGDGRRLQEAGGSSFETIAIVLSVLIGAAGYMVQAWSTRRAEISAADRALELQHSELTRQREHEQMVAQIKRTERWLDGCCRPVEQGMRTLIWARISYVQAVMHELESSHPQLMAEMLSFTADTMPIGTDGKVRSALL